MQLEDELCSFTKGGYVGTGSPNRADAFVWAMSALFPALTRRVKKEELAQARDVNIQLIGMHSGEGASQSWLGT